MGPFSLTGQPNAMGGREVGGLANQLAAHMGFDDAADIDRVRRFWNAPRIATQPGLKAVDLFDAVLDGRIKAIWIAATNPAASMPRAGRVREALDALSRSSSSRDCWPTDTTALADVVLPAAGWGEKDGTVTNSERRISRQRAFRAAAGRGAARLVDVRRSRAAHGLAEALSPTPRRATSSASMPRCRPSRMTARRLFDIGALAELDDAAYDALAPVQWPLPEAGSRAGTQRLFARGGFSTPDGRARMVPAGRARAPERTAARCSSIPAGCATNGTP